MPSDYKTPRKRLRLSTCNYRTTGYYFITICTCNRECLLGNIVEGKMHLNAAGKMIQHVLEAIQNIYLGWHLDTNIIMPNHVHAILRLYKHAINQPTPLSLSELIRNIKTLTTKNYCAGVSTQNWQTFDKHLWQRSYHEHIIRGEQNLNNIREYIHNNPKQWHEDSYNPQM